MGTTRPKVLIQLDTDPQPSVFDAVVAVDSGVDHLFRHSGVTPANVRDLVHGALFTRGPAELHGTAIFIGGSNVAAGEALLEAVTKTFFGPFRVSVLMDASGANTTAAAAVRAAARHLDLKAATALVLGGTGPVGQRVALLLARQGAAVCVGSRQQTRAASVCENLRRRIPDVKAEPAGVTDAASLDAALSEHTLVVAAGAAGVVLLPLAARKACPTLKVAIDLNAVPPLGVEGTEVSDKGTERDGVVCYGAIGVGDMKMKIHKAAVAELFARNDAVLDIDEIYQIALRL